MFDFLKKPAALLLCLCILLGTLSGCGKDKKGEEEADDNIIDVDASISGETLTAGAAADDVFSLTVEYDKGLNPITTKSSLNQMVSGLVYDHLFEVDDHYHLSSRILDSWYFSDAGVLVLEVRDDIQMHDGSMLTAEDIAYSISRVFSQGVIHYQQMLGRVYVSAYQGSVFISGDYVNTMLPYRLTLPIIKAGTILDDAPAGSGPYMFSEDRQSLVRFDGHENAANLSLDTIYLRQYIDIEDMLSEYESGLVDLAVNDPTSIYNMGYGGKNEKLTFSTTNMHYIGFNGYSTFLCYAQYRNALNYIVNRSAIANTVLDGAAVPASLPIHPNSSLYDMELAESLAYSPDRCKIEFEKLGCRDLDGDSWLEFAISGSKVEIDIDFIVCKDNASKVVAARKIAEDMRAMGLNVNLRELSWQAYNDLLLHPKDDDGKPTFDMYYAEVAITPDWNILPMVEEEGSLNFGKWNLPVIEESIYTYLAADEETRPEALKSMLNQIATNGLIIPVCFEEREVITHLGIIRGMTPNQYNIFENIDQWTVNLGNQ